MERFLNMADTLGSLIDKLCTVDLKMWNRVMEDADKDRRVNAALRAEHTLEEVDRLLDDLDNVVCSAKYKQAEGVN